MIKAILGALFTIAVFSIAIGIWKLGQRGLAALILYIGEKRRRE